MTNRLLLLAVLTAALAVSCRAELNLGLELQEDASGILLVEIGTDAEFRDFMESVGADPDELFGVIADAVSDEATLVERDEDNMQFKGVEVAFADVNEIADELGRASAAFGRFESFSYEVEGSTARFDAVVSAQLQDLPIDIPLDTSFLDEDVVSATFILRMPGTVTSTNADTKLPDGSLEWGLPLLGGTVDFHAVSDLGGGGFPWLWLAAGLIVVVGLAVVIAVVVIGRRQQRQAVAEAAAARRPPADEPSADEPSAGED